MCNDGMMGSGALGERRVQRMLESTMSEDGGNLNEVGE